MMVPDNSTTRSQVTAVILIDVIQKLNAAAITTREEYDFRLRAELRNRLGYDCQLELGDFD